LFGAGVFVLDGAGAGSGRVTGRERILNGVIDETSKAHVWVERCSLPRNCSPVTRITAIFSSSRVTLLDKAQ